MKAIIEAIESGDLDASVAVVISSNPSAPGLAYAKEKGLTTLGLDIKKYPNRDEYETEIVSALQEHDVNWVALAGYMRLVGKPLLEAYANKMVNIHPSLLPAFKGLNAQKQAFDYGVKVTGCTVHFVDAELDNGPIILQKSVPVLPEDTAETLSARILEQEHKLFPKALQLLAEKTVSLENRKLTIG